MKKLLTLILILSFGILKVQAEEGSCYNLTKPEQYKVCKETSNKLPELCCSENGGQWVPSNAEKKIITLK